MTETASPEEVQGGSGSQALLWVLGIIALVAGFIATVSSDADAVGTSLIGIGGLGILLALSVQAIRAAMRQS